MPCLPPHRVLQSPGRLCKTRDPRVISHTCSLLSVSPPRHSRSSFWRKLTTRAASSRRQLWRRMQPQTLWCHLCERKHTPPSSYTSQLLIWNRPATISQGRSQKTHSTGSPPLWVKTGTFPSGSKTKVLGPNPTHLFLQIKFYWNTAPPTHLLLSRAGFALKPQSSAVVTQHG